MWLGSLVSKAGAKTRMHTQLNRCRSFILRIWNDETDTQKQPHWRYVLLDSDSETRRCFTSLDQLFAVLAIEIGSGSQPVQMQTDIVRDVEDFLDIC